MLAYKTRLASWPAPLPLLILINRADVTLPMSTIHQPIIYTGCRYDTLGYSATWYNCSTGPAYCAEAQHLLVFNTLQCDGNAFAFSVCAEPLDLMIAIDTTQYWTGAFPTLISGLSTLVDQLNVGPNTTHIGVVTFNEAAQLQFGLQQYTRAQDVKSALSRITAVDGNTLDQQVCVFIIIIIIIIILVIHIYIAPSTIILRRCYYQLMFLRSAAVDRSIDWLNPSIWWIMMIF